MKNIVVFGAYSRIAEECGRLWSKEGNKFLLVGRDSARLASIANDFEVRGAVETHISAVELVEFARHEDLMAQIWKTFDSVDIVLVAHGFLPDQAACEASVSHTIDAINVNALSHISLLTLLANRLESQGHGTLAVISSVAADRGRKSNYVYGSAKALVATFCSGLMHRFGGSKVNILTIKPGLVITPMTEDFDKTAIWASAPQVAREIVSAVASRKTLLYTPSFWRFVMAAIRMLPDSVFRRLNF
jgi:short-subunit dehydrogenase